MLHTRWSAEGGRRSRPSSRRRSRSKRDPARGVRAPHHVQGLDVLGRGLRRWWRTPSTRAGCLPDIGNCWCRRARSTDGRNSTVLVAWSVPPSLPPLSAVIAQSPRATEPRTGSLCRLRARRDMLRRCRTFQDGPLRRVACKECRQEPYRPPFIKWAERWLRLR
jgi:hypothetical protein